MILVIEMLNREKEFIKKLIDSKKANVKEKQMFVEIDQVLQLLDKFKIVNISKSSGVLINPKDLL